MNRCQSNRDLQLVYLLTRLYGKSTICIGDARFEAERGVVQGAVLSPMLFNVYLEEALNSSAKLMSMRRRGDLLAFADDMLILTHCKAELEEAIN